MMVFSIFIAVFALMNSEIVPVNLIFVKLNLSAALVILISATVGAIIIYSFDALIMFRLRKKLKELEKKISTNNKSVEDKTDILETEQADENINNDIKDDNEETYKQD